jgi:hypothetical protein
VDYYEQAEIQDNRTQSSVHVTPKTCLNVFCACGRASGSKQIPSNSLLISQHQNSFICWKFTNPTYIELHGVTSRYFRVWIMLGRISLALRRPKYSLMLDLSISLAFPHTHLYSQPLNQFDGFLTEHHGTE